MKLTISCAKCNRCPDAEVEVVDLDAAEKLAEEVGGFLMGNVLYVSVNPRELAQNISGLVIA